MADRLADASRRTALIVEDDGAICDLVRAHLQLAGFQVTELGDGGRALEVGRSTPFDLLILDVMLPGIDGITLCRALRADGVNRDTPILIVTARDAESDKVVGLDSGADDYLTKPFGLRELLARVGAILRRSRPDEEVADSSPPRLMHRRDITLDLDRRRTIVRGQRVSLTRQEFDLISVLASRPGIVFSRVALLAKLGHFEKRVTERTVDTLISRLRRKIERDPQEPELVLTAWGVGYKFVDVD